MDRFIDPADAPKTGVRVMFYAKNDRGMDEMITAVFNESRQEWVTSDGTAFDPATANGAEIMEDKS